MAERTFTGGSSADKPIFAIVPIPPDIAVPAITAGLVQHPLVSPEAQVQILSVVDATGSASISDCIAALPGHEQPVTAVLALVRAGVLAMSATPVLDAETQVFRAPRRSSRDGSGGDGPVDDGKPHGRSRAEPCVLSNTDFSPAVIVASGKTRKDLLGHAVLRQPGTYLALWSGRATAYVGMGDDVCRRIVTGAHLSTPEPADVILAIADRTGQLTPEQARVCERILAGLVVFCGQASLLNAETPAGDDVDPDTYALLRLFVTQACLAIRQAGLFFTTRSPRALLNASLIEPGRQAPLRVPSTPPEGTLHRLTGCGVTAAAAEQDGQWLLLAGSEIRVRPVPSVNTSAAMLRAEWLYGGILARRDDKLVMTRDMRFASGSAAAHFVLGSKGQSIAGWKPLRPASPGHLRLIR